MKSIFDNKQYEYKVNQSKFITYCFYVEDQNFINETIKNVKNQHFKAKHVCYAYKYNSVFKYDDNQEPAGSSGKKILDVININQLFNILIIVVRYMSGNKLGLGLLTKSYYECAMLVATDINNICLLTAVDVYSFKCALQDFNSLYFLLKKNKEKIFESVCLENYYQFLSTLTKTESEMILDKCFVKKSYLKTKS